MKKKILSKKHKVLKKQILDYLHDKKTASTGEIYDHINKATRHGVGMGRLSNVLSKDPRIKQQEATRTTGVTGKRYQQCVWELLPQTKQD